MASRNRSTIHVDDHFRQWGESALLEIVARLDAVMPAAAEGAKTAEVRRASGALADSIHPLPAQSDGRSVVAGIGASDYKANWYELGTLARRSKRKSARGKSDKAAGTTSGVKGLHFLRKGLYSARETIFHEIGDALRRAQAGLL